MAWRSKKSTKNVSSDSNHKDSDMESIKAELTMQISELIRQQNIPQEQVAKMLGTTQPRVSALVLCKPMSVSIGRLMEFLIVLGWDIEIAVGPTENTRTKEGRMSIAIQSEIKSNNCDNAPQNIDKKRRELRPIWRPRPKHSAYRSKS